MAISRTVFCTLIVCLTTFISSSLLAQQSEEATVDGLIYDLKHPDNDRRKRAAKALGQSKVRTAVPGLIDLTEDRDASLRLAAVTALVRINDTRALNAHVRMTQDSKKEIQKKAIEGIVSIYVVEEGGGFVSGVKKFADVVNPLSDDYNPLLVESYVPVSPVATEALAELLFSPETGIRKDAAVALGILRAHSALSPIQQALSLEPDNGVKTELIRTIYKIGDPSAGTEVIPLVNDPDKKVHDEAIFTLGRLRVSQAVPVLKELYESGVEERRKILGFVPVSGKDDLQKKLLEALAFIGDSSCHDLFLSALEDSRDSYRLLGAEGLGRIGDSSDLSRVAEKYLQEKSSKAKLGMSFALYRMGRKEHLIEVVRSSDKVQAYHYLLEFNASEIQELYPYMLTVEHPIRLQLLDIFGQRGDSSAVPVIENLMQSTDPELASAANLAMRRIQSREASD
jgi:HEAT repeat protein